jgi:hypothetical protein
MSDPQANAEQLDEDELPEDIIPENFIEPEQWDAGAGADEAEEHQDSYTDEDDIGQERESSVPAEEAAMHVERGISEGE